MDINTNSIFSNVCRLCMKESKYLEPMFQINNTSFLTKIMESTSLVFAKDDGLPSSVCEDCIENVIYIHNFREQCYQSDLHLRQRLRCIPIIEDSIKIESQLYNTTYDVPLTDNILVDQSQLKTDYRNEPLRLFDEGEESATVQTKTDLQKTINNKDKLKREKIKIVKPINYLEKIYKTSFEEQHVGQNITKKCVKQSAREPKQCQICGKICIWLRTHMLTHAVKGYECEYCGKSFTQSSHYKIHLNIHTGNKPYSCDLCDKKFADPGSKRSHMVTHTKERKYKCDVCEKSFGYSHTLSAHKRTHTQDRKHVCSICFRPFLSKYGLTKHFRTHTGEKPYKCDFCDKRFTTSGNIQTHRRIHTRERPYKCNICQMTFAYKSVLNGHAKVHQKQYIPEIL